MHPVKLIHRRIMAKKPIGFNSDGEPIRSKPTNGFVINLASWTQIDHGDHIEQGKPYVLWGREHCIPDYLMELFMNSTTHGGLVNSIASMIYGAGFVAQGSGDPGQLVALQKWLKSKVNGVSGEDIVRKSILDLKLYGSAFIQVVYNMEETPAIAKVKNLPFEWCAPGRIVNDRIDNIYVCRDWSKPTGKNEPKPYQHFDPSKAKERPEQIVWMRMPLTDSRYFPLPDYYAASKSIELDRECEIYHLNNVLNQFAGTTHINFANGEPETTEKKEELKKKVKKDLVGNKNQGRLWVTFSNGTETAPTVNQLAVSDADKQYEFIWKFSRENTIIGHGVTSPMLFGIRDHTGLGNNADELRQSARLFERNRLSHFRDIANETWTSVFRQMGITIPVNLVSNMEGMFAEDVKQQHQHAPRLAETFYIVPDAEVPHIVKQLKAKGQKPEDILKAGYKLIYDVPADTTDMDRDERDYIMLAVQSDPDKASRLDVKKGNEGEWLVRYKYEGPKDNRNRKFCSELLSLGLLYRKEDIDAMTFRSENKEFGRYSIWKFKGSYGCRHHWRRQIFFLDYESGDINRVGRVPAINPDDDEATKVNPKPRRRKFWSELMKLFSND